MSIPDEGPEGLSSGPNRTLRYAGKLTNLMTLVASLWKKWRVNALTEDQLDAVWDKAKEIPDRDPEMYRQDPYGNVMYRPSYGQNSPTGWVVDHIKPKSRGGTDTLRNLQALNTKVNLTKGDSLVKKSRHSKGNK